MSDIAASFRRKLASTLACGVFWNKCITHGLLSAHLSKYKKAKGDSVAPGEVVAYVGNSGGSKGGHLHLEVFECDDTIEKGQIINTDASENIEMKWAERRERWDRTDKRVNPFNHTEH